MTIEKSGAGVDEAQDRVNNVVSRLMIVAETAAALAGANLLGQAPEQDQLDALAQELDAMRATLAPMATAGEAGPVVDAVVQPVVVPPSVSDALDTVAATTGLTLVPKPESVPEEVAPPVGDLPPQTPADPEVPGGQPDPATQLPTDTVV